LALETYLHDDALRNDASSSHACSSWYACLRSYA
jgi:hypothetical protein